MLHSAGLPLSRGNVVCSAGRSAVVWLSWPNVLRVFPIVSGSGRSARQAGDVPVCDLLDMVSAGVAGQDMVIRAGLPLNVRRRHQTLTGRLGDTLMAAVERAYNREIITARIEAGASMCAGLMAPTAFRMGLGDRRMLPPLRSIP